MDNELTMEEIERSLRIFNADIYEQTEEVDEIYLDIMSDGNSRLIKFLGIILWRSDEDERDFIEDVGEYEPLEDYLRRQVNLYVEKISKIKV